jgi:membrane protease YdiL (CAAX protease family)
MFRRPVLTFCLLGVGLTVLLQMALLLAGINLMPGKIAELVILTGAVTLVTARIGGRAAVRKLFSGLIRWRIGVGRWLLVLVAMPVLTIATAALTGTLHAPEDGWGSVAVSYVVLMVLIALSASIFEETAWTGFVQARLMARRGLLIGSLLTAIPFCIIHLPLAFEAEGWAQTSWREAFISWGFLLAALPFFRYLAGVLFVDTKGSVLAVALLHASFNASGAMSVLQPAGWQYVPAMIVLALAVAAYRKFRNRSQTQLPTTVDDAVSAAAPQPR